MKWSWNGIAKLSFAFIFAFTANGCTFFDEEPTTDWKQGIFYEIYVGSYYDSDGDKVGDLNGITHKLDYINDGKSRTDEDLQVNGLWLMPINPSPSYHKYDVVDYYNVDDQYGTIEDFKKLTEEAHKRGVKVIIDLVINHTSEKHPWFIEAAANPDSPYRDYYVWADEHTNVDELGPWGQKVWHRKGSSYYYGLFWSGMPDLNFGNPKVREEMTNVAKFWVEQGVDGFRLDAAMHIFPRKEEAQNHEWWKEFRTELEKVKPDVYLVGEVWETASIVAPYFQSLDSNFNFDLAANIMNSVNAQSNGGIGSYLDRVHPAYSKVNENFIDAPFLTNHDQNRVMTVFGGDVDKAKIAASILLTLPGNPFIYYGEEIGMLGQKPDEDIREPFRWYPGDGEGQTSWRMPRHNRGENAVSVEGQTGDQNSLLSHYRDLIRLRQKNNVLMDGGFANLAQKNNHVISFKRVLEDETLVVLHNISAQEQVVEITTAAADVDKVIFSNGEVDLKKGSDGKTITIPAYTTVVLK
jgi:alpha-amylase